MHPPYSTPFWKTAPLIRILLPLIAGIIAEWYLQCTVSFIFFSLACFCTSFFLFRLFQPASRFLLRNGQGIIFNFLIIAIGMLLIWQQDARHRKSWYGHYLSDSSIMLVKLNEPITEKARSYKADGIVTAVFNGERRVSTGGKILIYFAKDSISTMPPLLYGQYLLVNKKPIPISNSGNPGGFNYKRYAAFQLLYHQLFLKPTNWVALNKYETTGIQSFLFNARHYVISILQQHIGNEHQQLGIAEALLIGYKEDLDKELVQAYSNTGVVHIIAISGLHLGLIFIVLSRILNLLPLVRRSKHIKAILLLAGLWLFALITGGAASVLRSAVMFSVVIVGQNYFTKSSVYNSLAASAFILLCYNPYYLWDVGFQLSYLAVTGIIFLQPHIYKLLYVKTFLLRKAWELMSVTIAAQVAAFPICLYYFHQFPNLFLISNLIVLPLATVILYGGVLLIIVAPVKIVAALIGKILTLMLGAMNSAINFFNGFSFSVADGIFANVYSTWLLYAFIVFTISWLLKKNKKILRLALFFLAAFASVHVYAKYQVKQQRKIIIYNVSGHRAIDFIEKDRYCFIGDSALQAAGLLQNFHLKPARIASQALLPVQELAGLRHQNYYWQFHHIKMICIDSAVQFGPVASAIPIDVLLISNNPKIKIKELVQAIQPAVVVFDGSNNLWKIRDWKKECEELLLRCHAVSEQGAFVLNAR